MQYQIVKATSYKNLDKAIQALTESMKPYMRTGWIPQGGISVAVEKDGENSCYTVIQAIVKVMV